jgi:glycosyltransferase involved in cell wall biosynthesis
MKLNINLITYLSGFPYGTATANRILMLGKAIINAGYSFNVYTNNIFVDKLNKDKTGIYEGIPFINLHGNTKPIENRIARSFFFIKGLSRFFIIVGKMNPKQDVVYIYAHGFGSLFTMLLLLWCKVFRIKTVQEFNEWYHNDLHKRIEKFFVEGPLCKLPEGAIVISENINSAIRKINPDLKTIVIPVLGEPYPGKNSKKNGNYCFWMGLVDTYLEDVLLIIKACAFSRKNNHLIKLIICGPCSSKSAAIIKNEALKNELPETEIMITGYVNDKQLVDYYKNAYCFIIPLWNTERSSSRFPTKMASFMFSGKPVLTCKIGEPGNLLQDFENVVFFSPGDYKDLSEKIDQIMDDKELYEKLSFNSYAFASDHFLYSNYSEKLKTFFKGII